MKKIEIKNVQNGYILTVKDDDGKEKKYMYMNALALACGIIVRVHYGMIDEMTVERMMKVVFQHEEIQQMFATAQMKHVAREKELRSERDRYRKQRDEVKKEFDKFKKKYCKK